jgi:hypothetical protein
MPRGIKAPIIKPNPKRVRFCFDYLQPDHPRFPITECPREFFDALLRDIVRYKDWTMDTFMDMDNQEHRHRLYFKDTAEPNGFAEIDPSDEELWTETAWQFALPGERGQPSGGWRVHGFIVDDMFHIVWLDPMHKLDSYIAPVQEA